MTSTCDGVAVERKWSQRWRESRAFEPDLRAAPRPYYNLMMFPYPSAEGLHMGNLFCYVGSDVHGRFRRAQGYDVFEPMGFDAFGIHSENHALKVGRHPAQLIPANSAAFRAQLERIGALFDWSCAVDTTDPAYYRWTQWLLVQLFAADLLYRKQAPVNWCPSCRTVLAAEQAAGGACERCDTAVEKRLMAQWFARITRYAQRLLDNLESLDWSPVTRRVQAQWIGRSDGAEIRFAVSGASGGIVADGIVAFTTRPDTLWGATFVVLAPEHPLVAHLARGEAAAQVDAYVRCALSAPPAERLRADRAKTGVFTGAHAIHPATGRPIPVWVADYVVMDYGTGAIMAVPAHDGRDLAFARAYGLSVVQVIAPEAGPAPEGAFEGEGRLVHSGPFTGLRSDEAKGRIAAWLADRGLGQAATRYRLRDWCISRQRYWGPPIPIVHCEACGPVSVPESQLPVLLPHLDDWAPDGSGVSPLGRCEAFAHTTCPRCGRQARRETDVSDNFLCSSWYYLRYPSARDPSAGRDLPFDPELTRRWLPVDMYIGGNEHAVLHLLYTRFVTMALHDLGYLDFDEPFRRFRANGMITREGAKMSKSKGNVVSPDQVLDRHGADTLRTYLMFSGNFQEGGDFSDTGILGARRFLDRLWRYGVDTPFTRAPMDGDAAHRVHLAIDKVTRDLEALHYNTAIAALMELLAFLQERGCRSLSAARTLLQLAAPFAPFIAQELWERLGQAGLVVDAPWPQADARQLQPVTVVIVVQIDGRVRDRLQVEAGASQESVERAALARPKVTAWTGGRAPVRSVYVQDRLLSLVTAPSFP